jgi:mannose-6-phosphate isomerase-like protein (cupin superfamily)
MEKTIAILAIAACIAPIAAAQKLSADRWTQSQIIAKAQELEPQSHGNDGTASAKLTQYPNHFTMIALRHRNGAVEIHDNFADVFLVVKGHATLVTGGSVQDAKSTGPGEMRGTFIENGKEMKLSPGDVVHIPATLPHQLLMPKGSTFVYFVVKIKEK